jgi:predicted YcjX-like family ATPase
MANKIQFEHNRKSKKELKNISNITIDMVDKYSKWLLNECSCPYDEIEFLISTILESDKKQTIKDVLNNME